MNSDGYLPSCETSTDTKVNNCFSIYHTRWVTSGPKSNFICDNIPTKAIFFFSCSQVNSTLLITSELANQRARNVLFTSVEYTNIEYCHIWFAILRLLRTCSFHHVLVLQRTAKKCTKIYTARAQLLLCSLNLLFGDVLVAFVVVICSSSLSLFCLICFYLADLSLEVTK